MNKILFKAYPFLDNSYKAAILKVLIVAFFAVFFLYFFNNENDKEELQIFVKFGIIIALCQFTFLFLLPKYFLKSHNLSKVTVWQYSIWSLAFVCVCYTAIFLFQQRYYFKAPITFNGFKCFLKDELPTGFIICFVIVCMDYLFTLRKQLQAIHILNNQIDLKKQVTLPGILTSEAAQPGLNTKNPEYLKGKSDFIIQDENQKLMLTLKKSELLFIKAADNYIEIYFNNKGALSKELVRNKLSAIESGNENDFLFRVHRSYLCNLNNVVKISGNSKGYNLHFSNSEETVPVSRTKNEEVIEKINKLFTN